MSVALRGSSRGTLGTLRRTASLEYFLDMDKECDVEEVELTTPPHLISHNKVRFIHHKWFLSSFLLRQFYGCLDLGFRLSLLLGLLIVSNQLYQNTCQQFVLFIPFNQHIKLAHLEQR